MRLLVLILLTLHVLSCTKNITSKQTMTETWHPSIDEKLNEFQNANTLIFGKTDKADGRYCFLKYEGLTRSRDELQKLSLELKHLSITISEILAISYSKSALDFTSARQTSALSDLTEEEKSYLQKKSELSCLKVLIDRQVLKYSQKNNDLRISSSN